MSMLPTPRSLCWPGGHWTGGEGLVSTVPWSAGSPVLTCCPPPMLVHRLRDPAIPGMGILHGWPPAAVSHIFLSSLSQSCAGGLGQSRTLAPGWASSYPHVEGDALQGLAWLCREPEAKSRKGKRSQDVLVGGLYQAGEPSPRWTSALFLPGGAGASTGAEEGQPCLGACSARTPSRQGQRRRVGHSTCRVASAGPSCTTSPP